MEEVLVGCLWPCPNKLWCWHHTNIWTDSSELGCGCMGSLNLWRCWKQDDLVIKKSTLMDEALDESIEKMGV